MAGFVKVTLLGNLGKDPEVRDAGQTKVCNMRVACTERVKKGAEWVDVTEWVGLVAFGKNAEYCGNYLKKGSKVYASGRLQTREWTDKEGQKRREVEVIADDVIGLDPRTKDAGASASDPFF